MNSIKTHFKHRVDRENRILCHVSFRGSRRTFLTNVSCQRDEFSGGDIVPITDEGHVAKKKLDGLRLKIQSLIPKSHWDVDTVCDILTGKELDSEEREFTLINALLYGINADRAFLAESTMRSREHALRLMEEFLVNDLGYEDVGATAIKPAVTNEFQMYMINIGLSVIYTSQTMEILARAYDVYLQDNCMDMSVIPANPFRISMGKMRRSVKQYKNKKRLEIKDKCLTEREIQAIWDYEFFGRYKEMYSWYRYLALWQIYTGFSFIDLTGDYDFKTSENGERYIVMHRKKTGVKSVIPILPETDRVYNAMKELSMSEDVLSMNVLPIVDAKGRSRLGKYRYFLAKFSKMLGFKLTSHMLRHTFGMVMHRKGVSMELISKMMGHTSVRTTESFYVQAEDEVVVNVVNRTLNLQS